MRYSDEVHSAGDDLARERLAAYARIAELVLEQETALEADDLERFQELTQAVTELRERMGSGPLQPMGSPGSTGLKGDHADEAARLIRETLARSQGIRARLATLRQEAGTKIRRIGAGRATGRRYLEAAGAGPSSSSPRVDVKL